MRQPKTDEGADAKLGIFLYGLNINNTEFQVCQCQFHAGTLQTPLPPLLVLLTLIWHDACTHKSTKELMIRSTGAYPSFVWSHTLLIWKEVVSGIYIKMYLDTFFFDFFT